MATETLDLAETIYKEAKQLPPASLADLAKYLEFLKFKAEQRQVPEQEAPNLHVVKLRGLLNGYDVSPEALALARREMWRKLETEQP